MSTVIFLGAGASRAEGAPLQGELFREYFSSPLFKQRPDEMDDELTVFFQLMFGIDVKAHDLSTVEFPTFEEVLGLTDLAILRKESFRNFDIENRATNSGRLRFIGQYLVFLVAKLLDSSLSGRASFHRDLISNLHRSDRLGRAAFISTNYDILIDNAITELYDQEVDLDYGIDFRNFDRPGDWQPPRRNRGVYLMKPHGSLNWLYCPTCNELEITPKEKGVVTRLISDFQRAACPECASVFVPMIVPPTYYKDMNNSFLSAIWRRSDKLLREAEHIVFCGYSFPEADMHIKYLLKRAQTNRQSPLRFSVVNQYDSKSSTDHEAEMSRYRRFLGGAVSDTQMSFEAFSADPVPVLADAER